MSSFIAHSLTGVSIGILSHNDDRQPIPHRWLLWLGIVSMAPDIDYFVKSLHPSANGGLRITHSLVCVFLLPFLTITFLFLRRSRDLDRFKRQSFQVLLAGASHLMMDLVVGVTLIPVFWPFVSDRWRLPFGLLPSAGRLFPLSWLVWHNLAIECLVLLPLLYGCYIVSRSKFPERFKTTAVLWICSAIGMYWASTLRR
jgi:membrane-bound metal-dependent hydrolase YbcI (DUF457 family)